MSKDHTYPTEHKDDAWDRVLKLNENKTWRKHLQNKIDNIDKNTHRSEYVLCNSCLTYVLVDCVKCDECGSCVRCQDG